MVWQPSPKRYSWRVRYVRLPGPVVRVAGVGLRAWWRLRKPTTFGVKVLLTHPSEAGLYLVVRHSYGDSARWGLPGGAYKPGRESAEQAGVREVAEEVGLVILDVPKVLDTVPTDLEGKRDTLTIVRATPTAAEFALSPEIAEARWVSGDLSALPEGAPVSRWLTLALSVLDAG